LLAPAQQEPRLFRGAAVLEEAAPRMPTGPGAVAS
jgi:hypothetical protein